MSENKIMHVFDTSHFEDCDCHCIYVDLNDDVNLYVSSCFYISSVESIIIRSNTKI